MSVEGSNESSGSLYEDAEIISAVRSGNIGKLNKLLAKLDQSKARAEGKNKPSRNGS